MLRIYLLGSGPIAVPVLQKLWEHDRNGEIKLVGIGTQPDRPAGRKRQLMPTPVGLFAAENELNIDKYTNLNDGSAQDKLSQMDLDFLLVVSYGQLLKAPLLALPRYGCVNIHASLLPRYRGASPIVQAIANGDRESGVCFMDMEVGLDCGKVYSTFKRPLDGTEYADTLELELGELAAAHTLKVLEDIAGGKLAGTVQDPALATMTGKIRKSDGVINWQASAASIEAAVRAYTPWPGAVMSISINGEIKNLTVTRARVAENTPSAAPGTIIQADRRGWLIACGKDALEILEVVPPGKKAMTGSNFLNGCREPLTGRQLIAG